MATNQQYNAMIKLMEKYQTRARILEQFLFDESQEFEAILSDKKNTVHAIQIFLKKAQEKMEKIPSEI
jgi:hypothetical protein